MKQKKKLSIIIPVYNSEQYLNKCLNSVLNQSYKNVEIIVVNDCSKGNCEEIVNEYRKKDNRVKYIVHNENKGLFQARITGASIATGDYIAFLDSDDYVSIDFYRLLVLNAEKNNSDIVIGNMVLEYDDGKQIIYNLFNAKRPNLSGNDIIDEYFNQEGLSFDWHLVWNKIYNKKIWDMSLKHYKKIKNHLIMTEDFSFSTVLFYYAKKLTKIDSYSDAIFYCKHEVSSTSVVNLKSSKVEKNLTDLTTSFNFVESFLKEVKIYKKYKTKFEKWKSLYYSQQYNYIQNSTLSQNEKKELYKMLNNFCVNPEKIENSSYMYNAVTTWNNKLEKIKHAIASSEIKYVSFDIFDTLVNRPFFEPTDLFVLLDSYFRELSGIKTGIEFSKVRIDCEKLAREEKINKEYQDISLNDIYEIINREYSIDKKTLEKIKQKEIELEIRLCGNRNTGYDLYGFALALGKKVVCTSDMYLPEEVIKKILDKNGYNEINKLYVSSKYNVTKETGDLYKYVMKDLKIKPSEVIHIGDNYNSDIKSASQLGLKAFHLPKSISIATNTKFVNHLFSMFTKCMPFWQDTSASMQFIGIRTMIAVCANKYFDNPYIPFNEKSDFNIDPYLIGYYALGIYVFGVTKWLLDSSVEHNYNKFVFMARDGYLPMKAYKIMSKLYEHAPIADYVYVSRKSLIPVIIANKLDLYKLTNIINVTNHTYNDILNYIKDIIVFDDKTLKKVFGEYSIKLNEEIGTIHNFNKFIKIVIDKLYSEEKNNKCQLAYKKYFKNIYKENCATFDVGYSARPELYLSNLCEYPIDTYFLNINSDEAFKNSELGNFKLHTFFDAKPAATGFAYELMLSSIEPSCIGYNIENDKVSPIFEDNKKNYQERFVITIMQNAALDFISDMVDIFGEDIKYLYYQKYYTSLPIMSYINSSNLLDKQIFSAIKFEDDVRLKDETNMVSAWCDELKCRNQKTMIELLDDDAKKLNTLNLENRSKIMRVIFYMLYDRPVFREKMKTRFQDNKILYSIGKFFYKSLRKIRDIFYKIIYKLKKKK